MAAPVLPLRAFEEVAVRVRSTGKKTTSDNESEFALEVLDQRLLPHEETWAPARTARQMWHLIQTLAVRGAPLIGVAAALSIAQIAAAGNFSRSVVSEDEEGEGQGEEGGDFSVAAVRSALREAALYLRTARPTAVNLMTCLDIILEGPLSEEPARALQDATAVRQGCIDTAYAMLDRERAMCEAMADHGADVCTQGPHAGSTGASLGLLTHCNTGGLAVPGLGTALGVIRRAYERGLVRVVYVDETRPLLQGGRLTAWELQRAGVPYEILCDGAAASLMRSGAVQRCFVGADRIARNGDFANKIGTYGAAVVAQFHGVPFHGVAPVSTVDQACAAGADIVIEQRGAHEVCGFRDTAWAPAGSRVYNPAFDVTPAELVESLVLDVGVFGRDALAAGALAELESFGSTL
jgi:methylthioribose-1-phosphate isomerase